MKMKKMIADALDTTGMSKGGAIMYLVTLVIRFVCDIGAVVLPVLQITGVIKWSWLLVLSPIGVIALIYLIAFADWIFNGIH